MRVHGKLFVLGFPLVFAAGWLAGTRRAEPIGIAEAAPAATQCVDSAAMQANANLVAQLQESRAQLRQVKGTTQSLEAKTAEVESTAPSTLVVPKDEWSRMGKDGMLRVHVPCKTFDGASSTRIIGDSITRVVMLRGASTSMASFRLAAIGLTPEELPALEQSYARVHEQTWKKIRSACEKSEGFRDSVAENPPESDQERIETCRAHLVGNRDERGPAVRRVAELLAANAGLDRATNDGDRVLLATAQSASDLWRELEKTLGREKAKRVAQSGIVCLNETVYDVRPPAKDDDGPS